MINTKNAIGNILGNKRLVKDKYSRNKRIKIYPRSIAQWVNVFVVWSNDVREQREQGSPAQWMEPYDKNVMTAWKAFNSWNENWDRFLPNELIK